MASLPSLLATKSGAMSSRPQSLPRFGGWHTLESRKLRGLTPFRTVIIAVVVTTMWAMHRGTSFDDLMTKGKTIIDTPQPQTDQAVVAIDNTQPFGENKVAVEAVQFLGLQTSNNTCGERDLGFTGKLGNHWYAIHGDTLWCEPGKTVSDANADSEDAKFRGMVRNTISLMTDDVLKPYDLYFDDTKPLPRPQQFFTFNAEWGEGIQTGFGGTSICEVDDKTAALYYAVNHNQVGGVVGCGVARLVADEHLNVTVAERYGEKGMWWSSEDNPRYGDVAAYRDERSEYIYILGGAPKTANTYASEQYVYQARVLAKDAFDLSKYEYWHGRALGWKSELLKVFNSETAVMWNVGQGQITYNKHLSCYMYVHTQPGSNQVVIRTADEPYGPWSDDMIVYCVKVARHTFQAGQVYAGVAHSYLDPSGKTLTITYTNHPNIIEAIKVTFK